MAEKEKSEMENYKQFSKMKQKATLIIDGKEIDVKIDKKKRCIEIAEEDLKKLIKKTISAAR